MNRRGLSVVELILYIAFAAATAVVFVNMARHWTAAGRKTLFLESHKRAQLVADQMARDFREADPRELAWDQMPPNGTGTLQGVTLTKNIYDVAESTTATSVVVTYRYDAFSNSLIRTQDGVDKVVLRQGLVAPSASLPLVTQDTTTVNVVMLQLAVKANGEPLRRIVRRVCVRS